MVRVVFLSLVHEDVQQAGRLMNRAELAGFLSQREIGGVPGSSPPIEREPSD